MIGFVSFPGHAPFCCSSGSQHSGPANPEGRAIHPGRRCARSHCLVGWGQALRGPWHPALYERRESSPDVAECYFNVELCVCLLGYSIHIIIYIYIYTQLHIPKSESSQPFSDCHFEMRICGLHILLQNHQAQLLRNCISTLKQTTREHARCCELLFQRWSKQPESLQHVADSYFSVEINNQRAYNMLRIIISTVK